MPPLVGCAGGQFQSLISGNVCVGYLFGAEDAAYGLAAVASDKLIAEVLADLLEIYRLGIGGVSHEITLPGADYQRILVLTGRIHRDTGRGGQRLCLCGKSDGAAGKCLDHLSDVVICEVCVFLFVLGTLTVNQCTLVPHDGNAFVLLAALEELFVVSRDSVFIDGYHTELAEDHGVSLVGKSFLDSVKVCLHRCIICIAAPGVHECGSTLWCVVGL